VSFKKSLKRQDSKKILWRNFRKYFGGPYKLELGIDNSYQSEFLLGVELWYKSGLPTISER
jgi:hypothetical protein